MDLKQEIKSIILAPPETGNDRMIGVELEDFIYDKNSRRIPVNPCSEYSASALLKDLRSRGLLDETLVICTTEFGRQPAAQGKGRDHNAGAFTAWLAGGGIKGGIGYGATDELGFRAVENPTYCYDLHATVLHLLGLDHTQLTFYHNGIQRRLTDVHGHVIKEVLA